MSGPVQPLDPELAAAYLARLEVRHDETATLAALSQLHLAHLRRVPFENLDIHLELPIPLDPGAAAEKIARRGRGGFCFELNGAFAALLSSLGYRVELLPAQVHGPDGLGRPHGHLCLRVEADGAPWLVDVGFGRGGFDKPIPLTAGAPADDGAGRFELRPAAAGGLDLLRDSAAQYRLHEDAARLCDFEASCASFQTAPDSPFRAGTICTLRTAAGRVTLAGLQLIETSAAGRRERALHRAGLDETLRTRFGISLDDAAVRRLAAVGTSPIAAAAR